MMAEKNLYLELDDDVRKLLTLIREIKTDIITENYDKEKLERALFLTNKIQAELYQMLR